jgi:hypothetical protein
LGYTQLFSLIRFFRQLDIRQKRMFFLCPFPGIVSIAGIRENQE